MAARPYICESCQERMMMTRVEYEARSKEGQLVYCDGCFPFVWPRRLVDGEVRPVAASAGRRS